MGALTIQIISGILVAFWLILIGLAQVHCSIIPSFGTQCSHGEGDIWFLPVMYSPIGGVALVILIMGMLIRLHFPQSEASSSVTSPSVGTTPVVAPAPVDPKIAIGKPRFSRPAQVMIIAGIITLIALVWSMPVPYRSPTQIFLSVCFFVVPWFVPTLLIYLLPTAAIFGLRAKLNTNAGLALIVAMIPLGIWANALRSGIKAKADERATMAAIPKDAFPEKVEAIVIDSPIGSFVHCARNALLSSGRKLPIVTTHGHTSRNSLPNQNQVTDRIPENHLLIYFPRRSQFIGDRVAADVGSPSIEIYSVNSSSKNLVAVTYAADQPLPAFPPVLTIWGWYRGNRSTTNEAQCKSITRFLHRELLDKLR